jgi:8-oxo-dGTP pyrophosphatase MutT (NUDIX family)
VRVVFSIDAVRSAFARHEPVVVGDPARPRAAVALILRDVASSPDVLLIERAKHPEDPWSGHMAFPGGRVDPGDRDARAAAERETMEEVGLSLAGAEQLGRLDDLEGRHAGRPLPLVISAWVYHVPEPGPLAPNHEVETALWVPLSRLVDPAQRVGYPTPIGDYPGILVGEPDRHIVWGLTYRFLEIFLERVGVPLPERWPPRIAHE